MKPTIVPGDTPPAWNPEALLSKSQRYVEKMQEEDSGSWERALWSSLALEQLARSALASVSPALLADARDGWPNLLHSLGFEPKSSKFSPRSIAVSDVFIRLGLILDDFEKELENFCVRHTGFRNGELHSGETPFDGVPSSQWEPDFFRTCKVLLASVSLTLPDLFGEGEAKTAEKVIAASLDDKAKAVRGDVEAHKKVWDGKDKDEKERLARTAEAWATKQSGHRVNCPACGSDALVNGDPISAPSMKLADEMIVETQEHLPSQFECVACGLKVSGLSRLAAIGLGDRYIRTQYFDAAEYYAPQDEFAGYEEDNNEPF